MEKRIKPSNSILRGVASLSFAALFTKIMGVIYKVPLSYILGDEGMGYFNVAYTVFGFFYILSVSGIPKAITIVFSNKEENDNLYVASYILKRFFVFGVFFTLLFICTSPFLSSALGSERSLYSMLLIAPSIAFILLGGAVRGLLTADSNLMPIATSQIIEALSKLLLGLLFALIGVKINMSVQMISAFTILGITFGSIFSAVYLLLVYKSKNKDVIFEQSLDIDCRIQSKSTLKKVISVAIPITFSSSILSFTNIIDLGSIMRGLVEIGYSDKEAAAIYGNYSTLALPMLNLVISLLSPIALAILPRLIKQYEEGKLDEFRSTLNSSLFITVVVSAPICMAFGIYSFDLLDIIFDRASSASGYKSLICLSPAMIILPLLTVLNTALESVGRIKYTVISLIAGAASKLVSTFVLIRYTSLGILSASLGTVLSYLVSTALSLYYLKKARVKGINLQNLLLPIFISLISFGMAGRIYYNHVMKINSKIYAVLLIILSIIAYGVIIFGLIGLKWLIKKVKFHKKEA